MDFYKRVGIVSHSIPYGKVATYGQIALLCQKPKNSRQVGFALNRGMSGNGLPAHRVVNHQGYLSGAGSFSEPDTQQALLEFEGVHVGLDNRVDLEQFGWRHSQKEALDFIKQFEENDI